MLFPGMEGLVGPAFQAEKPGTPPELPQPPKTHPPTTRGFRGFRVLGFMGLLGFTAWGGYLPGARHVLFACKSPGGCWVAARQGRVACRPGRPLGLAEQPFLATAHGELLTWQSSRPARRLAEEQCDREARKETTSENCVELYRIRDKTSVLPFTILYLAGVLVWCDEL